MRILVFCVANFGDIGFLDASIVVVAVFYYSSYYYLTSNFFDPISLFLHLPFTFHLYLPPSLHFPSNCPNSASFSPPPSTNPLHPFWIFGCENVAIRIIHTGMCEGATAPPMAASYVHRIESRIVIVCCPSICQNKESIY